MKRCDCPCHKPGADILHVMACCYTCPTCFESGIPDDEPHDCPGTRVHLGVRVVDGVAELACKPGKRVPPWETSKKLPRKVNRVRDWEGQPVTLFSFSEVKVTCETCKEAP